MTTIRHAPLMLGLVAALVLAGGARAEDPAPAPDSSAPVQSETPPMATPGMGMGRGMGPGMGMGPMAGARCAVRKPGMMGANRPCCMHDDGVNAQRIEMLEKRLDMMQLMLEMLVRQQAAGSAH